MRNFSMPKGRKTANVYAGNVSEKRYNPSRESNFGGILVKQVRYAERDYVDLEGRAHRLDYYLLEEPGQPCRFGVAVLDRGGDHASVRDLTTRRERAEEVLELLARNLVTPVTLWDVVQDLL